MFGNWVSRTLDNLRIPLQRLLSLIAELTGGRANVNELELPPPPSCPISWQPSVRAPVFYGTRDYAPPVSLARVGPSPATHWPPGTFRVFFPSLDGSPSGAAILEPCGRYPLIMFLHGQCMHDNPLNYTKWYELPAELARSGYVVVVPHLPHVETSNQPPDENHADIPLVLAIMRWMRTSWEFARVLLPDPATGIVGHSFGALLGGQVALGQQLLAVQGQPAIPVSAYASLSGVWHQLDMPWPVQQLNIPKLFTLGTLDDPAVDVVNAGVWDHIPATKHRVVLHGGKHWDYLPPGRSACGGERGTCDSVGLICRAIVPAFFGKYLPPEKWPSLGNAIPGNLLATLEMPNSLEREFYAGAHPMLTSVLNASAEKGCGVTLTWLTANAAGYEAHPPHDPP